jgi:gamma-glutamylcyclotransferase (GGCT)/AIG2-like uncharacterized protein YtfP
MTSLLFVYGTLMRGFSLHRLLQGRAEYVGPGQVGGRLFDLGAYPAAVRDPGGTITGEVYRVVGSSLWTALDSAEGPQYHREEVTARIGGGDEVIAFIYWYRGPLRGAPIPGGDYRAHAPAVSIHHDPRA